MTLTGPHTQMTLLRIAEHYAHDPGFTELWKIKQAQLKQKIEQGTNRMSDKTITFTVRLSPEDHEALKKQADRECRTLSNMARLFILRGLGLETPSSQA